MVLLSKGYFWGCININSSSWSEQVQVARFVFLPRSDLHRGVPFLDKLISSGPQWRNSVLKIQIPQRNLLIYQAVIFLLYTYKYATGTTFGKISCQKTFISFLKKILFIHLLIKDRRREKEREKHQLIASHTCPKGGPNPQPRHVLWQGIKEATFWFAGRCPTKWATLVTRDIHQF